MKPYIEIMSIILLISFASCNKIETKNDYIDIGDNFNPTIILDKRSAILGIGNDSLPAFAGYIDGKYVVLVVDANNLITDIWYYDDKFITPEKYTRKSQFHEIRKKDIIDIRKTIYGNTSIYLRSGWKLCYPSKYANMIEIPKNATPTSIYKGRDEI